MKSLLQLLLLAACFALVGQDLSAQATEEAPTRYSVNDYFQVASGGHEDYLAMEKVWKKIHKANIKAGKYEYWNLTSVVLPSGTDADYNYVTRILVEGKEKMAAFLDGSFFPEDLSTILTKEEMAIVEKTSSFRTHVKTEVSTVSSIISPEEGSQVGVVVFNFFDYPQGSNHSKHVEVENEIWKPVHAARVADGKMMGWVLANKEMPWGAAEEYHDFTVDLYADMEDYLSVGSAMPYLEKVHAGKNVDDLWEKTIGAARLLRSEVRMILDRSTD